MASSTDMNERYQLSKKCDDSSGPVISVQNNNSAFVVQEVHYSGKRRTKFSRKIKYCNAVLNVFQKFNALCFFLIKISLFGNF